MHTHSVAGASESGEKVQNLDRILAIEDMGLHLGGHLLFEGRNCSAMRSGERLILETEAVGAEIEGSGEFHNCRYNDVLFG